MKEDLIKEIVLKKEYMVYEQVMIRYRVYWKRDRYNYLKELWGI
tara:strand:+ start:512 stop:643 length:132 start_codon:yes stop_codon:yes gene_type:complete